MKENVKFENTQAKNIQEIWDTMRKSKLFIIGIENREETQVISTEIPYNNIIEGQFPNLKKEMPNLLQEVYRTPGNTRKEIPSHNNQNTKCTKQRKDTTKSHIKAGPLDMTFQLLEPLKARSACIRSERPQMPVQNVIPSKTINHNPQRKKNITQ